MKRVTLFLFLFLSLWYFPRNTQSIYINITKDYEQSSVNSSCNYSEYIDIGILGQGLDGVVSKLQNKYSKKMFAKKEMPPMRWVDYDQEIRIMKLLEKLDISPKVICVGNNGKSFLMEFINGLNMKEYAKKVAIPNLERDFLDIAMKMVDTMLEIHAMDVVHLDAHLANWIYSPESDKMYLLDFTRAKVLSDVATKSQCWAPETERCDLDYSTKSDVYVLGLAFKDLFWLVFKINRSSESSFYWKWNIRLQLRLLIHQMREKNPLKRISMQEVKLQLESINTGYRHSIGYSE